MGIKTEIARQCSNSSLGLMLYIPVNNCQVGMDVFLGPTSTKQQIKCLAWSGILLIYGQE